MEQLTSLSVVLASTASIAFIHALAPDHWVPFVGIGRAQGWSPWKMTWVTVLSGLGHVSSSILIGVVGLALGFGLSGLETFESQRGEVAGLLLVGFGIAYALWGIRYARAHSHVHIDEKKAVTIWMLMVLFALGPCEPLIPLMFVSAAHGWDAVLLVSGLFGLITIVMMVGQALLAYRGIDLLSMLRVDHRHGHTIAGGVIAATGLMVMFLGI